MFGESGSTPPITLFLTTHLYRSHNPFRVITARARVHAVRSSIYSVLLPGVSLGVVKEKGGMFFSSCFTTHVPLVAVSLFPASLLFAAIFLFFPAYSTGLHISAPAGTSAKRTYFVTHCPGVQHSANKSQKTYLHCFVEMTQCWTKHPHLSHPRLLEKWADQKEVFVGLKLCFIDSTMFLSTYMSMFSIDWQSLFETLYFTYSMCKKK